MRYIFVGETVTINFNGDLKMGLDHKFWDPSIRYIVVKILKSGLYVLECPIGKIIVPKRNIN